MKIKQRSIYTLFIVVLLTTEFWYIELGGGIARLYHFLALLITIALAKFIPQLLRSRMFSALMAFSTINLIAALLSDTPSAALASLMSNYANLGIIIAVSLILISRKLSSDDLLKILLRVTIISIIWGAAQIVVGPSLSLSVEQLNQISMGFGPSFRTEANTFAKYLVLPFLLFLPFYLNNKRSWALRMLYASLITGLLINFTRTALIGVSIGLLFAFIWYFKKGQVDKMAKRYFSIGTVAFLGIFLIQTDIITVSDYAKYKLDNLFNKEELLDGGSSAFRQEAMQVILDNTLKDEKRMIIGNGWGQTYYEVAGQEIQAGGGDLINLLGFSGLLGDTTYLLYTATALFYGIRLARKRDRTTLTLFSEGSVFALIGMFVTGQMSGYLIAPEYYLLLGVFVYFSVTSYHYRSPT